MDAVNTVMPMPAAGAAGSQTKAQQGTETGKNGKNTDFFTSVLTTVADAKAGEVQGAKSNQEIMSNLMAMLAAAAKTGEQNTGSITKETSEVPKGNNDNALDAQTLAAIMALLGNQAPVAAAQSTQAVDLDGNLNAAKASDVNAALKAKDIPFAALQGKVSAALLKNLSFAQAMQNAAPAANDTSAANQEQSLLAALKQNTGLKEEATAVKNESAAQTQKAATEMTAPKVQVNSQMAADKTMQPGSGQNAKETKSTDTKKIVSAKDSQDASVVVSAKQSQLDQTVLPENQASTTTVSQAATSSESTGNIAGELLQSKNKSAGETQVSTGNDEQTTVFSSILTQHTDKFASAGLHTAHPVQDPHNVAGQIVEQAKLFTKPFDPNNSEMVIKLRPEHLGDLTLKVAVDNGVVSASFHSNNAEVRSIIEASLPQLKQELADQGLKVDNVDIYSGMSDFFSGSQQGELFRQQQQQSHNANLRNFSTTEDFVEAVEEKSVPEAIGTDGVDYRV